MPLRRSLTFCCAAALTGCGGTAGVMAVPGHAAQSVGRASGPSVYVTNQSSFFSPFIGSVLVYPEGANGDVTPTADITGSNTQLTQSSGIVVTTGGEILVANGDTNSIVGFPVGANGNVAPNIVIAGSQTGIASPAGLALDKGGHLYVANCGKRCNYGPPGPISVEEFAAGAKGNVKPLRRITGPDTQLGQTDGIAVDARGYIYVANAATYAVTVYAPRARGDAAPRRVLSGSVTGVNEPDGIAIDGTTLYVDAAYRGYIGRFRRNAGGNVPPLSTLNVRFPSGGPSGEVLTGVITAPDGTLYVGGLAPMIAQYAPRAKGNVAPLSVIQGPDTGLYSPGYMFVR